MTRVLVCGGRDFADRNAVWRELDLLNTVSPTPLTIIHGACPTGVDAFADTWMDHRCVSVIVKSYPANWYNLGRAAGPVRKQRMIDEGKPDLVIAFPCGRGTADMIRRARAAGIEVREIPGRMGESNG